MVNLIRAMIHNGPAHDVICVTAAVDRVLESSGLACLFCGKDIGPFRVLRDKEFCCSAQRQGYSARLGKALGQISTDGPAPAPLATLIPYKSFSGNNYTPSRVFTLETSRAEIQILSSWPLSVVPLSRDRAASLPLLYPHPLEGADFSTERQTWPEDSSSAHLSLELQAEPLSDLEPVAELDPAAAGPALLEVTAADRTPSAPSVPDPSWDAPPVCLPDSSQSPVPVGS